MLPELSSHTAGTLLVAAFLFLYWRSLPFVYHLRFLVYSLWAFFFGSRPAGLADFTEISLRVWPDDVDFNWHMGNSSYNKVADFARYAHCIRLGFGRTVGFRGANGGVYMRFKRALTPMEPYRLRTRVIGWDGKWLFLEQCFVGSAGRTKAAGLSKMVLRDHGHPIAPATALRRLGYSADVDRMVRAAAAAERSSADDGGAGETAAADHCMPRAARAMLEADQGFGKDS